MLLRQRIENQMRLPGAYRATNRGLDHILFDEIDVPHAAFNYPHFVARAGVVGVCAVTRFDTVWAISGPWNDPFERPQHRRTEPVAAVG
jgi:hypothetical protein